MKAAWDCVVVGAGPAGSSAAIELRRRGLDVLILDKAMFPRDKCCGDGLTAMALRTLEELEFDPKGIPSWNRVDTVRLRSPSSREARMKFPSGQGQYAAVVRRFELDQQLLTQAIKRDAVFLASTTVTSLSGVGDEAIILNLSNGQTVSASYLVAADGAYSSVRRMVGSQPTRLPSDWHAFRQYFPLASDPREIFVSFEEDLLPAYLWQFPLADGATNIGFGMHLGVLSRLGEMNSIWKDIQSRPHLRELFERPALERLKAWPIPAHISQIELSIGRVLFVGDAAAASDALSGEGIGQALETGQLVAKAIVEGGPLRSERVRNNYESSVHRALDRDHRWSSLLMRGLSHRRGARGGVRISGSNDWLGTIMARWMFEDIPRSKILSPLSVLGTRRGAFS